MESNTHHAVCSPEFYRGEFVKLEQLFQQLPFGVAIVDTDLRYIHLNQQMAVIDGMPLEEHIGRTVQEVDKCVAAALQPLLLRTIMDRKACVELQVEVLHPSPSPAHQSRFWLVCCFPLTADAGTVLGASIVVQDISEQKLKEVARTERLQFEAFLSTLSATFINVSVSDVDHKIEQALQNIVHFLGFDRSSVWKVDPDHTQMICTHSYALPGIKQPPAVLDGVVPFWEALVHQGEIFRVTDVDQMPDSQWREKKYCKDQGGIKSIMFIPASVGGKVVGFITFVSYHVPWAWPDDLIQRLRLLWEVFANALERKQADQKIQKALAEIERLKDHLEAENIYLRDQINIERKYEKIIGQSEAIRKVLLRVEQVATTDSTVLIQGETGTGKELIASAIHSLSRRNSRAMIKLNCAALPATLIETELFGHEKGAFTGASSRQIGRFEAANGSTIFLDEIGELPLELQSKLLRILQEGQFERVGSPKPVDVDVRVLAATNRNLFQAVKEGRFREDLYYRLNVFPISVPPLRERQEDIPLLIWSMVEEFSKVFGKTIERIPKKNMEALSRYLWPGNIRELRNMVERAMILNHGTVLVIDVPDSSLSPASPAMSCAEMERAHIISVLEKTGWRVRGTGGAAEVLGLKPTTLDSRIKKLGITRKSVAS